MMLQITQFFIDEQEVTKEQYQFNQMCIVNFNVPVIQIILMTINSVQVHLMIGAKEVTEE